MKKRRNNIIIRVSKHEYCDCLKEKINQLENEIILEGELKNE